MPNNSPAVEANSLEQRLCAALCGNSPAESLANTWFDQTIFVRLDGAAALIRRTDLTNHFRRSFGGALGAAASPQSAATHPPAPCPWEPPCALDVFFREQMRVDGDGLPKPFVTLADTDGADLIAGLRVFGFATEWMPAAEHAFIDALQNRVPWRKLGTDPPRVMDRAIDTCEGLKTELPPASIILDWITPLDAEKIDPAQKSASILTRLHRRLCGMARWHDATLTPLDPDMLECWNRAVRVDALVPRPSLRAYSGQAKRAHFADAAEGSLVLEGELASLWPLLRMGERCGVGRGAASGRGRYKCRSDKRTSDDARLHK